MRKLGNIIQRGKSFYVRIQMNGEQSEIAAGRDIENAKRILFNLKNSPQVNKTRDLLERIAKPITYQSMADEHKFKWLDKQKSGEDMYSNLKSSLAVFGSRLMNTVTQEEIEEFIKNRLEQVSINYCRKEMTMMRAVFNRAVTSHRLAENPFNDIIIPKEDNTRDRILDEDEINQLLGVRWMQKNRFNKTLKGANRHLLLVLVIADFTAMRGEEILAARWKQINFKKLFLHVPESKNGDKRDIPLHDELVRILEYEKARYDKLIAEGMKIADTIITYNGKTVKSVRKGFGTLKEKADIEDFHIHDLRHRAITRWKKEGWNDDYIRTIAGHRSISSMLRYAKITIDDTQIIMGRKSKPIRYMSFADYKEYAEWETIGQPQPNNKARFMRGTLEKNSTPKGIKEAA